MQFIMASQKLLMDLSSVAAHLAALCLARGCCIQTWCFDQVVQRSRVGRVNPCLVAVKPTMFVLVPHDSTGVFPKKYANQWWIPAASVGYHLCGTDDDSVISWPISTISVSSRLVPCHGR